MLEILFFHLECSDAGGGRWANIVTHSHTNKRSFSFLAIQIKIRLLGPKSGGILVPDEYLR